MNPAQSVAVNVLWLRTHICYADMSLHRNMPHHGCDILWLRHNLKVSLRRNMSQGMLSCDILSRDNMSHSQADFPFLK